MQACLLASCSQRYTVSVNDTAVFDPENRLANGQVSSPDLQGCINLALRQQGLSQPVGLTALSCANSEITTLDNIRQLTSLRFLDLGSNQISDLRPLNALEALSGLNLNDNRISDIAPLLHMPRLVSVSLSGNDGIPCKQLGALEHKIGRGLQRPGSCRD